MGFCGPTVVRLYPSAKGRKAKRGWAKKWIKNVQKLYEIVTNTEKSDLSLLAASILRHIEFYPREFWGFGSRDARLLAVWHSAVSVHLSCDPGCHVQECSGARP